MHEHNLHPASTGMSTLGTSSSIDTPDPSLTKVDGLWFDDGNLILQAENSLFRIYRGLLCARSSVFNDMFAFPPPPEGNRTLYGCPIVQTYDSAQDTTYFLQALLHSDFFEPPPTPTELCIVEGVLRLSTKYDVRTLRLRAMEHLRSTYPTTLDAWRTRDVHRTIPSVENTPFVVLNLAREFDMPWLIPSVAYCISSHDISKTLDGAEWEGSTRASASLWGESLSSDSAPTNSVGGTEEAESESRKRQCALVRLSPANQKLCIKGRCNILTKQNAQALAIARGFKAPSPPHTPTTPNGGAFHLLQPPVPHAHANANGGVHNHPIPLPHINNVNGNTNINANTPSPDPQCTTEAQCTLTRFRCADILTRWGTAGFLDFFDEQHSAFARGFCAVCLEGFKAHCARAGREMWEGLPGLFELPGWEELERVRMMAMR